MYEQSLPAVPADQDQPPGVHLQLPRLQDAHARPEMRMQVSFNMILLHAKTYFLTRHSMGTGSMD